MIENVYRELAIESLFADPSYMSEYSEENALMMIASAYGVENDVFEKTRMDYEIETENESGETFVDCELENLKNFSIRTKASPSLFLESAERIAFDKVWNMSLDEKEQYRIGASDNFSGEKLFEQWKEKVRSRNVSFEPI